MTILSNARIIGLTFFLAAGATTASGAGLPDGDGREAVEKLCTACHPVNRISRSLGYTRNDWLQLSATMVDLSADPARRDLIADYLAANFPPREHRMPEIVDGDTRITFREWVVPTLGQRARDPVEAPDGAVWWAGQWGNLVGRIDTATGEMREFPLPAGAMPHSVTLDRDGGVWFTGNKNATLGRLNPVNGEVTVYDMPDPAARDPHTAIFDDEGVLWFTLQHANRVGRLDPRTGEIKLATMPTAGARPYGIKIDTWGAPWVACNGSNCLVRFDPKTMTPTEIKLPHEKTTVRRLDIAADGTIWYVNSGRGRLGRYDPHSGDIREWPSPSGPRSHPYAIAVVDGIVWYNESGMRPDTLVRFDPMTETFQSWPISSGGVYAGIVRHMRSTRDGDLLIHQSATNRIIRVEIHD